MHCFNSCVGNAMMIHRVLYDNNYYHELYIIIILNDFYVHGHASKHIYLLSFVLLVSLLGTVCINFVFILCRSTTFKLFYFYLIIYAEV